MKDFLFVEKYRPTTIAECILPSEIKNTLSTMVASGNIPNMMFCGSPGCGKTTAALAMCNEIGANTMFINASLENGIDVLRSKIMQFASTVSLTDSKKVVILDEADYTNPQSFQPALRGFIEEFANNIRFIFTCNFKNRIIEPLHSRCSVIDFKISGKDKPEMAASFMKRVVSILNEEHIEYDRMVIAKLVQKHFPDFRRVLNEIQRYSVSGVIDSGILSSIGDDSIKSLIRVLKDKNFKEVRNWIGMNIDSDTTKIFKDLYDMSNSFLDPSSIPEFILIIADYQYKDAFVADKEINLAAAMVEVMSTCRFL